MKSKISLHQNRSLQKNRVSADSNYQIALQLYYIYKAETKIKKEPRLPIKDWRRPVSEPKQDFFLLKHLRQQIPVVISLRRILGSFFPLTIPFILKN